MDRHGAVELVCRGYCTFYKNDKDEQMACQGFIVAEKLMKDEWLPVPDKSDMSRQCDNDLARILCPVCPFVVDGCDYAAWSRKDLLRADQSGIQPCGGFLFLAACIEQAIVDIGSLNRVM